MSPQSEPGARVLVFLTRHLTRSLGDEYQVRPQVPLTLPSSGSEPEPDLAVVRAADAGRMEVFRDPDPAVGVYRTTLTVGRQETLSSTAVPGLSLPVAALFD